MNWFKHIILLTLFIVSFNAKAQVGVGTKTPDKSAQMEVSSDKKGFLPPRVTKVQRDAIESPANGLPVINSNFQNKNLGKIIKNNYINKNQ